MSARSSPRFWRPKWRPESCNPPNRPMLDARCWILDPPTHAVRETRAPWGFVLRATPSQADDYCLSRRSLKGEAGWGSRPGNSPPAAICGRRPRRKGGGWSAIDHSLVGVSHDAQGASVTGRVEGHVVESDTLSPLPHFRARRANPQLSRFRALPRRPFCSNRAPSQGPRDPGGQVRGRS